MNRADRLRVICGRRWRESTEEAARTISSHLGCLRARSLLSLEKMRATAFERRGRRVRIRRARREIRALFADKFSIYLEFRVHAMTLEKRARSTPQSCANVPCLARQCFTVERSLI